MATLWEGSVEVQFLKGFVGDISVQDISRRLQGLTALQRTVIFLSIDLALLPTVMLISFALQTLPGTPLENLANYSEIIPYLVIAAVAMSLWLGLPAVRLNSFAENGTERTAIIALTLSGLSAFLGSWYTTPLPLGTHAIFGICYFLSIITVRLVLARIITALYRQSSPRHRVLIYGAGVNGSQIASALRGHKTIDAVAFVDDNTSLRGIIIMGLPVYSPARMADIVKNQGIDRVLLAMPSLSQAKLGQLAMKIQGLGVDVQALPSFAQLIGSRELLDKMVPVAAQSFLRRPSHYVSQENNPDAYQDRVILVSGAGGSIGSELCRQLLSCKPKKLVLYEQNELALYNVHQELMMTAKTHQTELSPVLGSVMDALQVRKALSEHQVQVVLHAAAYKHVPLVQANPLAGLANNVIGTQTLARAVQEANIERFILISSDKAVRPTNVMGASKRMAEQVIQDLASRSTKTIFSIVRFGNVLGSSGSVVPLFQEQVRRGGPVTVTDPRITRYFMTIHEAVQLVLRAADAARGGEIFVLDMGKPVSILQLARQVIESAGYRVRDENTPDGEIEIQIIGLRPGEKITEELTLADDLIRTPHPKIFSAPESPLSEIEVAAAIKMLQTALASSQDQAAHQVIEKWVEGYIQADACQTSAPMG